MFAINGIKDNVTIILPIHVKDLLKRYRQNKKKSKEACGILIGTHSTNDKIISIKSITEPTKKDIRSKFRFKMNSESHQNILNTLFLKSNNEYVYLGTWHSHPEAIPYPSREDTRDWRKQFNCNKHLFQNMIFAIVGTAEIKFWLTDKDNIHRIEDVVIMHE